MSIKILLFYWMIYVWISWVFWDILVSQLQRKSLPYCNCVINITRLRSWPSSWNSSWDIFCWYWSLQWGISGGGWTEWRIVLGAWVGPRPGWGRTRCSRRSGCGHSCGARSRNRWYDSSYLLNFIFTRYLYTHILTHIYTYIYTLIFSINILYIYELVTVRGFSLVFLLVWVVLILFLVRHGWRISFWLGIG